MSAPGTPPPQPPPEPQPPPGSVPGAQGHGAPPPAGQVPGGLSSDSRTWGMIAHLSALIGLIIGFSFVGPLIVYLIKKDEDPFVRDQAAEALNFNLSFLIYLIGAVILGIILTLILIGIIIFFLIPLMVIPWLIFVILAGVAANRGEAYRYPLTIRFVN